MRHRDHVKGADTSDAHFERFEQDNGRQAMATNRSRQTSQAEADNYSAVWNMKGDAMDEAYGAAGKDTSDARKIQSQFMDYNWS